MDTAGGKGAIFDFSKAVSLEAELAEKLSETAKNIAHSECFDDEQRAEIHEILAALKTDTAEQCKLLGKWVRDMETVRPNA